MPQSLFRNLALALFLALSTLLAGAAHSAAAAASVISAATAAPAQVSDDALLDDVEQRTFRFFWDKANPGNGLLPDHYPLRGEPFSSIAATGFALTGYGIGAERGWVSRNQAAQRVLITLRFFANAPQGSSEDDDAGYHGFYYHFLSLDSGRRYGRQVEVSTIDTTLLLGGVLFCQSYFDRDTQAERDIRKLAVQIYRNVDWNWAQARPPAISMGWTPGGKFIPHDWQGYNEAMLLYILALGSPTHALAPSAWQFWTRTYARSWGSYHGQRYLAFAPLFGHQYSHAWIDFRAIQDVWMRKHGLDYFQNSRRAVLAQQAYAIANPHRFKGYDKHVWGLTASNGPAIISWTDKGRTVNFRGYSARGAGLSGSTFDDGTIAPTAAIASLPFAPQQSLDALRTLKQRYGKHIYRKYGFIDAFNPSFRFDTKLRSGSVVPGLGWFDDEYLGIDQGPILLMIENYRSGLVWRVMRGNPYIRRGLQRAGFTGGWLDAKIKVPHTQTAGAAPM